MRYSSMLMGLWLLCAAILLVGCPPAKVQVPEVIGLTQAGAEAAITGAELIVGAVTEVFSDSVEAGIVISQDPIAGTSVNKETPVSIVVSKGPEPVEVPDVTGQARAAAETALTSAGLVTGDVTEEFSASVAAGVVISQAPAAGASVLPGTAVNLVVSKGPEPVNVPDVTGLEQTAAEAAISTAGLALGSADEEFSATVPSGHVISQAPAAGTSVLPGTPVDLMISKGPEPVLVPNVVGQTQAAAGSVITGAGLTVGTVTEAFHATAPAGQVISQAPAAGASVLPGTAVDLVISKGPEPVNVPNVVGQTQEAAQSAITGAGLTVGTVSEEFSASAPSGQVISQNPAAGESVLPGTAVNLVVSKGPEPPTTATVPNVVGQSQAAAQSAIAGAGLTVGTITQQHSATVPQGSVISQNPAAGASADLNSPVSLVISLGPVIPISLFNQTPTHKTAFTAAENPVTITGLASGSLANIGWQNQTTGSTGTAMGTANWSATVSLAPGDNDVRITANPTGSAGLQPVHLDLVVTYNLTALEFTTLPSIQGADGPVSTGIAGETYSPLYVRVGVSETAASLAPGSLQVYRIPDSGPPVALGTLADNGDLSNGDEIEGDGIYSGVLPPLSADAPGPQHMRIIGSDAEDNTFQSALFAFTFFAPPTEAQIQADSENNDQIIAAFSEIGKRHDGKIAKQQTSEMVAFLEDLGYDAGTCEYGAWWINDSGIFSIYSFATGDETERLQAGTLYAAPPLHSPRAAGWADPEAVSEPHTKLEYLRPAGSGAKTPDSPSNPDEIKSLNAVHVYPYNDIISWYTNNTPKGWDDVIEASSCPTFSTSVFRNTAGDPMTGQSGAPVPLSVWKSLSNYGVISSVTHGDTMDVSLASLLAAHPWIDWVDWLFPWHDERTVLHTNLQIDMTTFGLAPYLPDLLAGRLMLFPMGQGRATLLITPEFIDHYNSQFPNSIWINMACRSAYNDTMAAAFLAKGGGAYFGYTEYVLASYAFKTENTIFHEMVFNGKTAGEARSAAIAAHGAHDGQTPVSASLAFYGNANLVVPSGDEIQNPSFEEPDGAGSLQGWNTAGDGRVIKVLGPSAPTQGTNMAIISTGLGFTTQTGEIRQTICLPPTAQTLLFDWNFYSEEFKEYCNSQYDDTFLITLEDVETGDVSQLFFTSVNDLCACCLDALIPSPISFDRGDVWYTGWQYDETLDISPWAGRTVTLRFFATDVGDSIYDTAVLIDNIRLME